MKRLLIILVAALAAVSVYAMTATGGQQAVTPKQFNALKATVSKQGKTIKALEACLFVGAAPVIVLGNPDQGNGYVFRDVSAQKEFLFPAMTVAPQSLQGQAAWVVLTTPQCAAAMNSKPGAVSRIPRLSEPR